MGDPRRAGCRPRRRCPDDRRCRSYPGRYRPAASSPSGLNCRDRTGTPPGRCAEDRRRCRRSRTPGCRDTGTSPYPRRLPSSPAFAPYRTLVWPRSVPPPICTSAPCVCAALLVTMLMMPLTALAPHSAAPGPRTTSIRSMSSSTTSCTSQNTPENSGV